MKKIFLILVFFLVSTKAYSEKYFWKCYDDMLMSTITNKIQNVEKFKFKNSNVYVNTDEGILKYWLTSDDLVKSFSEKKPIKHDFLVKKILVNDDMIVATHKPYKKDYPDEYNIFNLDLRNKRLIKVTEVNKKRYIKYYDCKEIPLK